MTVLDHRSFWNDAPHRAEAISCLARAMLTLQPAQLPTRAEVRWIALRLTLATQLAAALNRSPAERAKIVRGLVETVMVEEKTITIKVRAGALFHRLPC